MKQNVIFSRNTPIVSIIIPVYNDNERLKKCLTAIAEQTMQRDFFETIVIDNASDNSPENTVKEFDFTRYVYEGKPGSYAARNKGISCANGQYLAFLDADCLPKADWLETGVKALQNKHCLVGGNVILTTSDRPTITETYQFIVGFQQKKNIEEKEFSVTANLFVKKEDALKIGSFDERLMSGGDRAWCWKARKLNYPIRYCSELIVETPARKYLSDAIKQTRRVAGGRFHASQLSNQENIANLSPHRTGFQSILWILSHPKLSFLQRLQVFILASFLKFIAVFETYRLILGAKAERI